MKETIETRNWVREKQIFLDGTGQWPKEVLIKKDNLILHYRLIRTRAGKFQLVK
jgi:hypothetical protein